MEIDLSISFVVELVYHRFDISFNNNSDGDHGTQQGQANHAYFASPNTMVDIACSGSSNHVTTDAHNLTTKADYKGKVQAKSILFQLYNDVFSQLYNMVDVCDDMDA